MCVGWSDLYHVPIHLAADFGELMRLFTANRVFHEVAVPSILHVISDGGRAEQVVDSCFGCCCCDLDRALEPKAVLRAHACAHRIEMRDTRVRAALEELL